MQVWNLNADPSFNVKWGQHTKKLNPFISFECENNVYEIIACASIAGVKFDLLIIGSRASKCENNLKKITTCKPFASIEFHL